MNIVKFIDGWLAAANRFDTSHYLEYYLPDAILDDPSVGNKFSGHKGIKKYFDAYFIGYQTQTKIVKLTIQDANHVLLEVAFEGNFPEGNINGTFEFTFRNEKIALAKADLVL